MTIAGLFWAGLLFGSDFVICDVGEDQNYPAVAYFEDLYHVFWTDRRFYPVNERFALYGARVNPDGHVLDPDGRLIYCDSTSEAADVAHDNTNLFVVARNHC